MPAAVAPKKRGRIEFAFWANILGLQAAFLLILGGILGQSVFPRREISVYCIAVGAFIGLVEYPRGKRKHGNSNEARMGQHLISPAVQKTGVLFSNYFIRAILYLGASVPAFFVLADILGGITLVLSALVYFVAALRNESWAPIPVQLATEERRPNILQAPTQPPPRLIKGVISPAPTDAPPRAPENRPSQSGGKRRVPAELPPAPSDAPPLPPSKTLIPETQLWQATLDPKSGQTYYYNIETRQVSWERPEVLSKSSRV